MNDIETQSEAQLRADVEGLCSLGPRALTVRHRGGTNTLDAARDWLLARVAGGPWHADAQPFDTPDGAAANVEVRHADAPEDPAGRVLLVGAHYDTWRGTPGADDNASAVAALLHMLGELQDDPAATAGRLRFALYANEEPPYFGSPHMGSLVHAELCRARGWDVEMLCLESLGYYDDEPGSQEGLPLFYDIADGIDVPASDDPEGLTPRTRLLKDLSAELLGGVGDFLALEADAASADLLGRLRHGYDAATGRNVRTVAAALPRDYCTGLSDHQSYWQHGYPAVMATDTAPLRNPNYHEATDTPETLDYPRLAAVASRLAAAVRHAAGEDA